MKRIILSSFILGMFGYSLLSYADDTEIYFSDINKTPKPNVIFLLDTSGSMTYTLNPNSSSVANGNTETTKSRLASLKEAVESIMANKDVKDLRMGVLNFSDNTLIRISQEVVDIDEIDKTADIPISDRQTKGSTTILRQRILIPNDDGIQRSVAGLPALNGTTAISLANKNYFAGFRFDNILLKKPAEAGITNLSKAVVKAELTFRHQPGGKLNARTINTYMDPAVNASRLNNSYYGDFNSSGRMDGLFTSKLMDLSKLAADNRIKIDVTDLIRAKISEANWQSGNAIVFIVQDLNEKRGNPINWLPSEYNSRDYVPYLTLEVDNKLIAENKRTKREKIMDAVAGFEARGGTYIVSNLLAASKYISNIDSKSSGAGPYHDPIYSSSPLTDDCQMTHIILMSDGQPEGDSGAASRSKLYLGQQNLQRCQIFDAQDKSTWTNETSYGNRYETCGRALASWMARTSHAKVELSNANYKTGAFVRTHTIGFAMKPGSSAQLFLEDIAKAGQGIHRTSADTEALVKAFQDIIENALLVNKPSASGTVSLSPQSGFDQRSEVFYSLYKSQSYDYWAGNMKGFKMIYQPYKLTDQQEVERAVLADWSGAHPVVSAGGTFKENFDTAWSTADSGDMIKGGVLNQLDRPENRNAFTNSGVELKSSSYNLGISDDDLKIPVDHDDPNPSKTREQRGKGLLDFIRGYTYKEGGSVEAAPKKIGDSANNGVTLISYGCAEANKTITTCSFEKLDQVALVATNDGFFRGYNLVTGKNLYEFMPKEMLPVIDKLQAAKGLNINKVRSYGLDGRVVVYHDDVNRNGYIDNGETAMAIVVSGRGGSTMYGIDISNKSLATLKWVISKDTAGFSKLGNTWSVPAIGKVKLSSEAKPIPVLVFGGGYDESQDTEIEQHKDDKGNALYVINPISGALLWSTSSNMKYSIPGDVALLTDTSDEQLITDIFFGDMGGQLWRFKVNNGAKEFKKLFVAGGGDKGIVASISGDDEQSTRRFYQKPMLYKLKGDLSNYLSVNIGSGYRVHPLVKSNNDRFYSFRFPLEADIKNDKVIKDKNLPAIDPKNTSTEVDVTNGFKVLLGQDTNAKGEKVVSNAFADMDRLVFNTYIPYVGAKASSCYPIIGTQRTYYFSLSKGVSLLKSGYTELTPSTLPLDVVAYCNTDFCSIISSMNELSSEASDLVDAQFFKKDKNAGIIKKTTWTDLFSPEGS